ncbi:MAG: hypothetical protein Q8L04_14860, partial [Ignavibacteria bacterium]|nr:hypothetical protein [Ignavibacteria bacterium]
MEKKRTGSLLLPIWIYFLLIAKVSYSQEAARDAISRLLGENSKYFAVEVAEKQANGFFEIENKNNK